MQRYIKSAADVWKERLHHAFMYAALDSGFHLVI